MLLSSVSVPSRMNSLSTMFLVLASCVTDHRDKDFFLPCGAPVVKGWKVCRLHGARGGGPSGRRNGNYRSGAFTKETMEAVALLKTLARLVRKM